MFRSRRLAHARIIFLAAYGLLAGLTAQARPPITNPRPPVEPAVAPVVARNYPSDKNSDRIQDSLAERAQHVEAIANNPANPTEHNNARRQLGELVEVELIFSQRITQPQLDAFLGNGGEVTHVYEAVSHGWNGRLPLGKVIALPKLLGNSLVQVEEALPGVLHLDTATRTGRVRPVWAAGFANNPAGFDGNSNITISVLDSGVDETHTDLNGRRVFWNDYTADSMPSPFDRIQHGTHVAGIALGTGAAAGSATGNLLFTDEGDLTGVPGGSFFPSPFGMAAVSTTVTLVATWQGGGSTTLYLAHHTKGVSGGWAAQASATGPSPLTLTTTFTPLTTRAYTPALIAANGVGAYAVTVQAPEFASVGDGFNKLRGVAPGCSWAGAKVFSNDGSGNSLDINAGIDGLVANRVANNIKVMNISLGIIGNPGISASQRAKVNTAVNNGIVVVCSAGNDGSATSASAREVDDPGRAALAITVAAANDNNQLTDYTSAGFASPGSTAGAEEDYKPDVMAPGGSSGYYTSMMSVDSNSGDGQSLSDQRANDYYNIQGTSMAAPFVAGSAALVIDALQQRGTNWNFNSSQHPRLVKMLLCATASESNANRDSAANNPTLQRANAGPNGYPTGKDQFEGYGMMNPDAAVEAVALSYLVGSTANDTLGGTVTDKRAWARGLELPAGQPFSVDLTVPGSGDFDMYLYSRTPSAYGTPILIASSTTAGNGVAESLGFTPATATNVILVVKRVSGNGTFSLLGSGVFNVQFTGAPTNGSWPLAVKFTNLSSGATNFAWNFGDGNVSSVASPTNIYLNAGTYTVSLTAIGGAGTNTLTRTNYITVTNPPPANANFVAGPLSGLAPLVVAFTNLSVGATSYLWDFGDGQFSTTFKPTNTFALAGTYSVSLTAMGPLGTNTFTRTNYIVVTNQPPLIVVQPQSLIVTQGTAASFTVTASGSSLQYQWRKNGTNISGATTSAFLIPNTQPANIGGYSVFISNVVGSVLSATASLSLVNASDVIIVTGPPYSENFNVMGSGGTIAPHGWFVGTGSGAISSKTVTVGNGSDNSGGNYNLGGAGSSDRALGSLAANSTDRDTELRFINQSGAAITAFNVNYTGEQWRVGGNGAANNALQMLFSLNGTTFSTMGGAFDFNTPVDSGSANALDGNNPANRVTGVGGMYTPATPIPNGQVFFLRWADADNSSQDHAIAVDDLAVSFTLSNPPPSAVIAAFTANTTEGLAPLTVNFTNLSVNALTYAWDFGDGNTSTALNPANTYSNAGVFSVSLTASGPGGTNTVTLVNYIIVTNIPPPAPVADFFADTTAGLAPLTVNFTNLSVNATEFVWEFGDGNTSTNFNASNTYSNAGAFSVTLTAIGAGGTNSLTFLNYITVTNAPPPPLLAVTPSHLAFGPVFTGALAYASFVISNAGGSELNATASLAPAEFALLNANTNIATEVSFEIPVSGSTNLQLRFSPSATGAYTNFVTFVSNGGDSTNTVTGLAYGTPVILDLVGTETEFHFSFATVAGVNYTVQFKDAVDDALWQTLQSFAGDGSVVTVTNVTTTPAQRFYRVRVP